MIDAIETFSFGSAGACSTAGDTIRAAISHERDVVQHDPIVSSIMGLQARDIKGADTGFR
jgi:hypothetical protein